MSYVQEALAPGETVRAVARLHWVLWLRAIGAILVLGIFVVGIFIGVRQIVFNLSTEIAATDRRLIRKTGLLQRRVMDMNLNTIEAVNIDQDFFGQLLGYGRVTVHGTGDDKWVTPLIANPLGFRRDLQAAMPNGRAPMPAG